MSRILESDGGIVLAIGIAIMLAALGIGAAIDLSQGNGLPPCHRSGVHRIILGALNEQDQDHGTLVVCNDGRSYWP